MSLKRVAIAPISSSRSDRITWDRSPFATSSTPPQELRDRSADQPHREHADHDGRDPDDQADQAGRTRQVITGLVDHVARPGDLEHADHLGLVVVRGRADGQGV